MVAHLYCVVRDSVAPDAWGRAPDDASKFEYADSSARCRASTAWKASATASRKSCAAFDTSLSGSTKCTVATWTAFVRAGRKKPAAATPLDKARAPRLGPAPCETHGQHTEQRRSNFCLSAADIKEKLSYPGHAPS